MPPVRVKYVVSFSSQDPKHSVEDLVNGRGSWLNHPGDKSSRLQADLQLDRATTITYIDIGNAGSVMVSLEVGRSSWPHSQPLVTLLPAASFMTPEDWRAGKNKNTVRMFKPDDLSSEACREKWDKVRIVCVQPFRKNAQFGLSLFRLHTNAEVASETTSKAIIDLDIHTSQTEFKKEELMSRMNLPSVKKKTIPQKIGWLENKVLNNSEETSAGAPLNPFTSPISRAARLISMAAKPLTKKNADLHSSELECEALEFLISLNLSVDDIYSLKVIGVRQQFENQRQKKLDNDEKIVFKDIALDYAKRRLETLEKQKSPVVKSLNENGMVRHSLERGKEYGTDSKFVEPLQNTKEKTSDTVELSNQDSKRVSRGALVLPKHPNVADTPPLQPRGKFTFRRVEAPGRSSDLLKKATQSPHSLSSDRVKLRQDDDLSFKPLSSSSRNNLALSDSKVVTPRNPTKRKQMKGLPPRSTVNKQSNLDVWINSGAKRRKENKPFSYSARNTQKSVTEDDNDDGLIIDDDDDNLTYIASSCNTGGGFIDVTAWQSADSHMATGSSTTEGNSYQPDKQIPRTIAKLESDGSGYCLGAVPVDKYGSSIITNRSQENSLEIVSSSSLSSDYHTAMVECPLCSDFFQSSQIEAHAASCGISISSDSEGDDSSVRQTSAKKQVIDADNVEECPVCGDLISSSDIEDHAPECATSMFG
ncbi:uncharacterized protein [Panulirus ornatus]|uniref:uncharacterized protein n=1 Tax=Panulirus ornatus TaxID=150431 RepID=UPI003A850FF4